MMSDHPTGPSKKNEYWYEYDGDNGGEDIYEKLQRAIHVVRKNGIVLGPLRY